MKVEAILLTHAHFDHMGGVDEVRKACNCPVYIHDLEAEWLTDPRKNGSMRWSDVTSLCLPSRQSLRWTRGNCSS